METLGGAEMLAAEFSSDSWFEQQKTLSDGDAYAILRRWQSKNVTLAFGYFRSRGGVMQTGHATVFRVRRELLTLDTKGSRLVLALTEATFGYGNLGLMTADFRAVHDVDGLSIFLNNQDWVFLFEADGQIDISSLTGQIKFLP